MAIRDVYKGRQFIIIGAFVFAASVLLLRAVQMQLLDTSYQNKAAAITIEKNILYPSRGVIYDRNGKLLVYNNPLYDLMVTYKQVSKKMDTVKFCRLLGIDSVTFKLNLEKDWKAGRFSKAIPFPFMTMVPPETFARFQESMSEFPGFFVQVRNVRGYPQHNGAHLLGYLNEVNQFHTRDSVGIYENGDYIGAAGLESKYEPILRGKKGVQYILKDNVGRLVGPYKNGTLDSAAVAGKDLLTSIDMNLQALGEKLLEHKVGAIVALDPTTGEILALVSAPTYDPEKMVINKNRKDIIRAMYKDSLKPLFDRSVTAEYTPGSVYKPMMGLIALHFGWDKNSGMGCAAGFHYGSLTIKCHNHAAAGNIQEAIEHSCNNYFCSIFKYVVDDGNGRTNAHRGLDKLDSMIYRFGCGKSLGVDFPAERKGLIPTSKYYDKNINDKGRGPWYSTTIISDGIGQGENQMTTLQIANMAAAIANRGYYYTPHIVRGYKDSTPIDPKYKIKHDVGIDRVHYDAVVDGMYRVIESGTGSNARVDGVQVCGKTGTSQNPHGDDSSVFLGFAPRENPKIVVAVYVENGGWGNDYAAPITGLMIEQFLKGSLPASRQPVIDRVRNARLAYSDGRGYYVLKSSAQ
jgi:penicillin-binding protein 2